MGAGMTTTATIANHAGAQTPASGITLGAPRLASHLATHISPLVCAIPRTRDSPTMLDEHTADGHFVVVEGFFGLLSRASAASGGTSPRGAGGESIAMITVGRRNCTEVREACVSSSSCCPSCPTTRLRRAARTTHHHQRLAHPAQVHLVLLFWWDVHL